MNRYDIKNVATQQITHAYEAEEQRDHDTGWGELEHEKLETQCSSEELASAIGEREEETHAEYSRTWKIFEDESEKLEEECTEQELLDAVDERIEVVPAVTRMWKTIPATYEVIVTDITEETNLKAIRALRAPKLVEVDDARNYMIWAEAAGTPWTVEKKEEWADYRQALLNITEEVNLETVDVEAIVWPAKPSLP